MSRRVFRWTPLQLDKLNKVKTILTELQAYKPLTLRQIYYQLVGKGFIDNNLSQYGMLSGLLKQARIEGLVSWEDIEDRGRTYHDLTGWNSSEQFVEASLQSFLTRYQRDLLKGQKAYIELWIEKDALSSIFTKVAAPYTVPVVVCKGFSSISFLNDYKVRLSYQKYKEPVLLYFGDFDPSGVEMLKAMETTLQDELKVTGITFKRIALSKDDIFTYKLPHSPDALKKSDTRAAKHIAEFGELAVELDALTPPVLEAKIKAAIEEELELSTFYREVENNRAELDKLNTIKQQVTNFVESII